VYTRQQKDISINLTPLIDVVFLLLIFFMVSTTFTRENQIPLDLPKADVEKLETEVEMIEISVDKENRVFFNGEALINSKSETLKRAILKVTQENSKIPVIISADANTAYQSVISVMETTSELGLSNIKMATQRSQE
jgi:biopolymer transport protein ExbD